jgi:hypothetical protein
MVVAGTKGRRELGESLLLLLTLLRALFSTQQALVGLSLALMESHVPHISKGVGDSQQKMVCAVQGCKPQIAPSSPSLSPHPFLPPLTPTYPKWLNWQVANRTAKQARDPFYQPFSNSLILSSSQPNLVLRDTLCSCGMRQGTKINRVQR